MYFVNNTKFDIAFDVNLLTMFSSCATKRYWNEIKHVSFNTLEVQLI